MPLDVKAAVAGAFLELVRRKSADKITAQDLVEACGISRQTFYYHFRDIVDVMEWAARQAGERILEKSLQALSPQEALETFVSFTVESWYLIERMLSSQRRDAMERIMVRSVRGYLEDLLSRRQGGPALVREDWETTLDFYAFGVTGLLLKNCGRRDLDQRRLADQLYRLLSERMLHPQKD